MRNIIVSVTIIIVSLLIVSCGGSEPIRSPAPPSSSPPTIDAKKLYMVNCAVCHGPDRQGVPNLGPALTPTSLGRKSDGEIRNTILKGRPNTAMVGFEGRLSAGEVEALLQLIKYSSP